QKSDFGTLKDVCFFPWIEIEYDMRRTLDVRHAMQKRVQLQRRHVRRPCQRANVVDQNVVDVRAAFAARNQKCFDPSRSEGWRILFVKGLAEHTIRVTL